MKKPTAYWRALRREWSRDGWEPTDTGWLLSLTIVIVLLRAGLIEDCHGGACTSKFEQFVKLKPSEMGDALAGFFSALAFIWIIVTVFIQSRELREQRKEFTQQREATQNMAKAMATQAAIFQNEQRQRDENRAEELLNERLRSLVVTMSETGSRGLVWNFSNAEIDDEYGSTGEIISYTIGDRNDENLDIDEALLVLLRRLTGMRESLLDIQCQSIDWRLPARSGVLPDLVQRVQSVIDMKGSLSPHQQERLNRMRLQKVINYLQELDQTPELWTADFS